MAPVCGTLLTLKYVRQASWLAIFAKTTNYRFWKGGMLKQIDFFSLVYAYRQINNGLVNTKLLIDPWIPSLSPPIAISSSSLIIQDPKPRVSELIIKEPKRWNMILLQTLLS